MDEKMDGWMNETGWSARASGRTPEPPALPLVVSALQATRPISLHRTFFSSFLFLLLLLLLPCFVLFSLFLVRDDLLLESGSAAAAAAALLMKLLPRRRWPVPKIQNIVEFNNIKVAQDETVDSCGRCVVEIQVCAARGGHRGGGQGQKLRSTSESSPAAAVAAAAASITKA